MSEVMKKQISSAFFIGMCVAAILASFVITRDARQLRARDETVSVLSRQVDYLSKTVVDLRQEIGRLHEKRVMNASKQTPIPSTPITPVPPLLQELNPNRALQRGEIPGGQPFEFNGKTYYLTPLSGSGGPAMTVAK